jgi:hypothetical protein
MNDLPSPLGEAIEALGEAAEAYLDGPVAHLRAAVDRAARPDYTPDTATADAATYGLHLARAFWRGISATGDAIAVLAVPPGDRYRFEVKIPVVTTPSTIRIVRTQWTWMMNPEPPGTQITLVASPVLVPSTDRVRLQAQPLALEGEPSWEVDLEIVPVGSAAGQTILVRLDPTTRVFN